MWSADTNLPKLQMSPGELVGASAHLAFPFSQKDTAWVGRVCNQDADTDAWTFQIQRLFGHGDLSRPTSTHVGMVPPSALPRSF